MTKQHSTSRIRVLSFFIFLFALALIGKLYYVQIVQSAIYSQKADHQYLQSATDFYDRGSIFFTSKDGEKIPAASLKTGYILALDPQLITDAEGTYEKLKAVLPTIDKTDFMDKADNVKSQYAEIQKMVSVQDAATIGTLKLPGVNLYTERWRYYPGDAIAAQTVGFIGYNGSNDLSGQGGLERYYGNVLDRNNDQVFVNFFAQIFSNIKTTLSPNESFQGDVDTSIEPNVEAYLDQELAAAKEKWQSTQIGGIVMDPNTGAIFAMDSLPSFDPNDYAHVSDPSVLGNPLVQNVYEMGSIVKPLTMSAAIDSGTVTPASTYNDTGCITVNSARVCNYDFRARGVIPMQQILSQSLNVGAAHLALSMGQATMRKYFLSFGLGSTTGIDLPSEQSGLVANLHAKEDVDYATAAFGQGIAVSPLETIRALATIANGGYLVTPHVASKIIYDIGGSKSVDPAPGPRVMSTTTAETVTDMLINVVDQVMVPANPSIAIPHYSIASKTGTAQIPDPATGGYYPDRYLHSFFAFFPAHNPRFIIFMYQVWPKGAQYASATLTQSVFDMVKYLVNYYELPPDR